jgi:hypothetical protein
MMCPSDIHRGAYQQAKVAKDRIDRVISIQDLFSIAPIVIYLFIYFGSSDRCAKCITGVLLESQTFIAVDKQLMGFSHTVPSVVLDET